MWKDTNDKILKIYDSVISERKTAPLPCPICNTNAAHFYMHRYSEKKAECGCGVVNANHMHI